MIESHERTDASPDDDTALIRASWQEPDRFAEIFHRHFAEIHGYIARRLGRDVADDLAAETFLAAFRNRTRFDPERGEVRPWLYGFATNLIGSHRRAERRYFAALARTPAELAAEDHGDRAAGRADSAAHGRVLAAALGGLTPGDRDVLLLTALAGLGYAEIGQALGIPAGTVGSRLARARKHLRAALGGVDPTRDFEE
jgi:RNA polymerase sigma-70 factor (ECF subfamily)